MQQQMHQHRMAVVSAEGLSDTARRPAAAEASKATVIRQLLAAAVRKQRLLTADQDNVGPTEVICKCGSSDSAALVLPLIQVFCSSSVQLGWNQLH
jgi:hypothetical protein